MTRETRYLGEITRQPNNSRPVIGSGRPQKFHGSEDPRGEDRGRDTISARWPRRIAERGGLGGERLDGNVYRRALRKPRLNWKTTEHGARRRGSPDASAIAAADTVARDDKHPSVFPAGTQKNTIRERPLGDAKSLSR